jgi:hypothetical protein
MDSTLSATRADPLVDGDVAATVAKDSFTGVEEALTRLAHQAASDAPDARPGGPATADARISRSFAAATLGPADLSAQIPRQQPSRGKRRNLARVAIVVCFGASAILAWRSYGSAASDVIATWAPSFSARPDVQQMPAAQTPDPASAQAAARPTVETPPPPPAQAAAQAASTVQAATTAASEPAAVLAKRRQIETMARDLAALRATVDRLAAGQEQLGHELAGLQAEKPRAETPAKRTLRRPSAPAHDAFDPALNPNAPGVPRSLGSIVLPR